MIFISAMAEPTKVIKPMSNAAIPTEERLSRIIFVSSSFVSILNVLRCIGRSPRIRRIIISASVRVVDMDVPARGFTLTRQSASGTEKRVSPVRSGT